jgi:hypothetical protein
MAVSLRTLELADRVRADIEAEIEAAVGAVSTAKDADRLIMLRRKLNGVDVLIASLRSYFPDTD